MEYETTGDVGHPHWEAIFEYILRQCGYLLEFDTVYVMVDNRNLAEHKRQDPSLPHWPAAARWWHSRLKLIGPHKEKTELLLFPISATSGLHHVHPTWAGTFVLAALVAVFPGLNFVLLDSDCLPVTLFEVADLWTEAFLARFPAHSDGGLPKVHPLLALQRFRTDPQVEYTQHRVCSTRMGQGALVVTEPHSELNAGLIVIFRSSHPSLFDWKAWTLLPDVEFGEEASKLAVAFWGKMGEFLVRSRTSSELSDEEKALWIQSGLAVSPLMGTCLQYSLDFCLAWALIGEWTSRVLFPVPKGQWPRHGHAGALLQDYQCRTPRIVAWARAAFEQGALPSLVMMPGIAPVFSLPGDRMFQATGVEPGFQRPAIMRAYGGAKTGMAGALATIAPEGWLPLAAAMLGTGKPPMWASVGLRPVVGTTIDLKVQPPPLSEREKLLLLSCWQQWDPAGVQGSALSQWLVGVEVEHGPDGLDSPTFLKQNFDVQEAVHLYEEAHLGPLEDFFDVNGPYPDGINQLTLRITTYEYPLCALLAVYFLSATGHMPAKFPTDQWIKAVQWHGDSKVIAVVNTEAEWADAKTLLAPLENVVVEAESKQGAVVWSSAQKDPPAIPVDSLPLKLYVLTGDDIQRHLPETLHVEATGLGGRDLSYPICWDISIRTDKEGQSVYGPSLAPLEETVIVPGILGGTETLQVSALGRSKAAQEFFVLHYFALDSAKHWDELLTNVLPAVRLPGASARRATALELFGASHIQPSHRRMPHVLLWTDSMTLIWNLLMGGRMGRYTGFPDTLVLDQRVDLRGFSAGSFAGLSTLQLLWKIPNVVTKGKLGAIACPPQLLVTPPTSHALHLLHYESDQLCVWKPGHRQLDQLQIRFTYVSTEGPAYKEHFGAREHSYSHWLSLDLPAGWWDLARFLFMHPTAASSAKRDATPLRLLSWLSFRLEPSVEALIEETMLYLSTAEKVRETDLLALGTKHLDMGAPLESAEALRDHLIELVSVRNLKHRPEALFALFRQFLQRLTLPRLCHFLDLVLPQLTPVRAPWADATRTLWTCHHIRAVSHENGYPYQPKVAIVYFFTAHDNIHHVRVLWGTLPLLLFSDP